MKELTYLKNNYTNPLSPIAFSGINKIYNYFDGNLSKKEISNFLSKVESYTLHKEEHKFKKYNITRVFSLRDLWQIDLVQIDELKDENDGVKNLLCCIDAWSRRAFVEPLLDKKCTSTFKAICKILSRSGGYPRHVASDAGSEFNCGKNLDLFDSLGVNYYTVSSDIKCGIVERFQKTLQKKIYMYMTEKQTKRYINVLQDIVHAYNMSPHSLLKLSPYDAELPENQEKLARFHSKIFLKNLKAKQKSKFKLNDPVRISEKKTPFSRSYNQQFKDEIFFICKINTERPIPRYYIKDENGEELKGFFYGYQLTLCKVKDHRLIILKSRMKNKKKEYYVQFKGYSSKSNRWIPAKNLKEIKD